MIMSREMHNKIQPKRHIDTATALRRARPPINKLFRPKYTHLAAHSSTLIISPSTRVRLLTYSLLRARFFALINTSPPTPALATPCDCLPTFALILERTFGTPTVARELGVPGCGFGLAPTPPC